MKLTATERTVLGKKTKHLRKEGSIPAELYGHNIENKHLSVDAKDFGRVFEEAGESSVIYLSEGEATHPVIIQAVDIHPITDEVRNIDFYKVNMDEKVTITVPLEFTEEAGSVKLGGVLVKALSEVEVECLPGKIPHTIAVDLSQLDEIGKVIHISDIPQMEGVKILNDEATTIALISEPKEEPEEKSEANIESVVVESEEKRKEKEEGGEDKTEG